MTVTRGEITCDTYTGVTASQVHFRVALQVAIACRTDHGGQDRPTSYPQRPNIHVFERDGRTRRLARLDAPRHGTSPCDAGRLTPEFGKLFSLERLRLFLGLFLEPCFSFCIRSILRSMCQYRMPVRMFSSFPSQIVLCRVLQSTIYILYNARRSFSENHRLDGRQSPTKR